MNNGINKYHVFVGGSLECVYCGKAFKPEEMNEVCPDRQHKSENNMVCRWSVQTSVSGSLEYKFTCGWAVALTEVEIQPWDNCPFCGGQLEHIEGDTVRNEKQPANEQSE